MAEPDDLQRATWAAIGDAIETHLLMLRETDVLEDAVVAPLAGAVDGVRRGDPPAGSSLPTLIDAFDERLDALSPAELRGAAAVGRGRAEVAATAMRLVLRERLLRLLAATAAARIALLDLADAHVFTLMPAYAGSRPVQPTTLAHFLGGTIAPLGRAAARLRTAYAEANRSPLGAGALASTGLPIDRAVTAGLLGCDDPVPSTFDAVAAVDLVPVAVEPAAATAAALRRLLEELLAWLRADPGSLRVADEWLAPTDPALPGFRPPEGIAQAIADARRVEADAATAAQVARDEAYGPTGSAVEAAFRLGTDLIDRTAALAERVAGLIGSGIEVNRASLANRAGREHTTSGELADFLMAEEGIDPASARAIASIVVRGASDQGIEASGITPAMIDAAALMVIGRELAVEIERLGGFLAPRRFLERRTALGAPAPAATRDELERERTRLLADERWRDATIRQIRDASARRERLIAEVEPGAG